jgi:hypothetical protein
MGKSRSLSSLLSGATIDGNLTTTGAVNVYGDLSQSFSGDSYPSSVRRMWEGTFDSSFTLDLFTLNSAELPFAGTIYATAYKSAEGVAGVWTAACIYPTVTPQVNNQSYVARSNESITLAWAVANYSPALRVSFGDFVGTTTYTILVDGVVQQNYGQGEGPL